MSSEANSKPVGAESRETRSAARRTTARRSQKTGGGLSSGATAGNAIVLRGKKLRATRRARRDKESRANLSLGWPGRRKTKRRRTTHGEIFCAGNRGSRNKGRR